MRPFSHTCNTVSSHLSLNCRCRWGTRDDFTTSFLYFVLFSNVLLDLAKSRPIHSLMLSSHLFFLLPCLLPSFTVPCKKFWPDLMNRRHVHNTSVCISLRQSEGLHVVWLPVGSWHWLPHCMRCLVSCSSTSFPWLVFFNGALLWGSMIHKHTGRLMTPGSASVISWNWEKYSCHSKLVSTLPMLLWSVLSWRVSRA